MHVVYHLYNVYKSLKGVAIIPKGPDTQQKRRMHKMMTIFFLKFFLFILFIDQTHQSPRDAPRQIFQLRDASLLVYKSWLGLGTVLRKMGLGEAAQTIAVNTLFSILFSFLQVSNYYPQVSKLS